MGRHHGGRWSITLIKEIMLRIMKLVRQAHAPEIDGMMRTPFPKILFYIFRISLLQLK